MGLIIRKLGGSSVVDADRIRNVARIIIETYRQGHRAVAVLSAQDDTTDDPVVKAVEINPNAFKREMDMLLSIGEQTSCSLCAVAIEVMGYSVVSLTSWQADFRTNSFYGDARIKCIDTERVLAELDKNTIVTVTDFQGLNEYEDITTLGRGGSDTPVVALAAVPHADLRQIYTDMDDVYTADPRHVEGARKLEEITYDEMLELATPGIQVFYNRSVEMAKHYGVNLEVLSSFSGKPGTKVKEVAETIEKLHVSGVACDKNVVCVAVVGLADEPGIVFKVFSLLTKEWINVDLIFQPIGRSNTKDISFTVNIQDVECYKQLLDEHRGSLRFDHVNVDDKIAKAPTVGTGMVHNPDVAVKMFEALYNTSINISMIPTSEIKVSVLVDINEANRVVQAIHDRFFYESGGS